MHSSEGEGEGDRYEQRVFRLSFLKERSENLAGKVGLGNFINYQGNGERSADICGPTRIYFPRRT